MKDDVKRVSVVVVPGRLPPRTVVGFEKELRRRLLTTRRDLDVSVSTGGKAGFHMSHPDPDLHGAIERITAALTREVRRDPQHFWPAGFQPPPRLKSDSYL